MELTEFSEPARFRRGGAQTITIARPDNLKIQIVGPSATVLLNETPPHGKKWVVLIRVDIEETDE
jgi:hypothetical protein